MSYNSNALNHQRSRSFKQFSREGFSPLPNTYESTAYDNRQYDHNHGGAMGAGGAAASDVERGIPLEQVRTAGSATGNNTLRPQNSMTALRQQETEASKTSSAKKRMFARGRRQKIVNDPSRPQVGWDGEEDALTTMGKIYHKILNFSVITRYLLYVAPLAIILAIPIIVGASSESNPTLAGVPLVWFFVWVEIFWLSLWASKIVAHFLPFFFRFFVGVVSSGVRKYSLVLSALEIPLSLVGWAVTSLATFVPIMTQNPISRHWATLEPAKQPVKNPTQVQNWESIVQKILGACVVASLLFLGEKFFIQLISINYHRKQFTARIHESKRNVWLLGLLYDASRTLFPQYCNEFAEEDYAIADQLNISRGLGIANKDPAHQRTGSATPMRIIQNVGRFGDKITSAFGNVAHEITGRDVFNANSAHSIVVEALEHKRSSEALAKRIWMSFVVEGRDALTQEDVMDVMGVEHRLEAEEAFTILDRDANGDVSLDEMILTVTDFKRERKAIANSMHDVDQAINVLDNLLLFCVFVGIVLVFIAFLVADFTTTLATAGTALLSLSFVFSTSAQEVLSGCIFLFVKHPYDIGDRVNIGGTPAGLNGNAFAVEHISLLFTTFRHMQGLDCGQICQIPHLTLNTLWIENISRSKAMSEQFNINIAFDTAFDDLQILKNELLAFVTDKDNSRDYLPSIDLDVLGTLDQSMLTLQVEVKHKSNWANETIRRARRSKFMCALVAALRAVPINAPGGGADAAGSAANPNYSVAISDADAKKNAAATAKDREDARLVPLKKTVSNDSGARASAGGAAVASTTSASGANLPFLTLREEKVVDALTTPDPASDPRDLETRWNSDTLTESGSTTLGGSGSGALNVSGGGNAGEDENDNSRPSFDRQSIEEVRGMLRRESTKGKRKPGASSTSEYHQTVPTIYEPGSNAYDSGNEPLQPPSSAYGLIPPGAPFGSSRLTNTSTASVGAAAGGYENQRPWNTTSYNTTTTGTTGTMGSMGFPAPPTSQSIEMRQVPSATSASGGSGVARSPSNPYRPRGESMTQRPLASLGRGGRQGRGDGGTAGDVEEGGDEMGDIRPYSGV